MHFSSTSILALAATATNAKVLSLPFHKEKLVVSEGSTYPVSKRDLDLVSLNNTVSAYYATLAIGTPAQNISVQIDTGSSDLWLMSSTNSLCASDDATTIDAPYINCTSLYGGLFDPSESSTFVNSSELFAITYGDTTMAEGLVGYDTIGIGSSTVSNFTFAVATTYNSTNAVCGVGFSALEATEESYPNLPMLLYEQGVTGSIAYSLYLESLEDDTGTILFGGYDTSKYSDDLQVLPIVPQSVENDKYSYSDLNIEIIGIEWVMGDSNKTTVELASGSSTALLDSGTSLQTLPSDTFQSIVDTLEATTLDNGSTYYTGCNLSSLAGELVYKFNGANISVPFSELLLVSDDVQLSDGTSACYIGITPSDDEIILGDTFLRSAYIVYDLEQQNIGIAQAKYNVSDSNIKDLSTDGLNGMYTTSVVIPPTSLPGLTGTHTSVYLDVSATGSVSTASVSAIKTSGATSGAKTTGVSSTSNSSSTSSSTRNPHGGAAAVHSSVLLGIVSSIFGLLYLL